ncbi:signal transduction histidine kinase [Kribbella voronezhensis]|uniref:histidine kinase n=1 Tax=Kribbella voronezhensis TaxID=2512212 RepID=A0A4R7T7A8_9ACTN|nr:HAMP domain-containing sensor histidine kinase [Kribbella voronezhensis]TDU87764.1 signal transduction histidine kinase [Kribbella voronezhensis]
MRRQLAGLVAAITSLVLIAFLAPIALLLRSEAAERAISVATLDAQSTAQQLPGLVNGSLPDDGRTTVFLANGKVLGTPAAKSPSVELALRGESFVAETTGGREVMLGVVSTDGNAVVRVFIANSALYAGVTRTWALLALLGVTLFVLGMVVADRIGRRMVAPVLALAGTADRLRRGDMSARTVPAGPPEVQQVGRELNQLADRIDELLSTARAEAADLAHRLRTPLTALRLDIDGLRDPQEAARLADSLRDLTVEVDELIRTARRPVRSGAAPAADLAVVARERLTFWSALAEDIGRPLTGEIPERQVIVRAGADDLGAVFDVLLDNAFRHTPTDSAVRLVVQEDGQAWVEDAGQGLSPAAATAPGTTGLGLDIARRTAAASGGSLHLEDSPLGGVRARLVTPLLGEAALVAGHDQDGDE